MSQPKKTREKFMEQGNAVFNGFYNYDKTVYQGHKVKVVITCPKHGDFEQLPGIHLKGHRCWECGVEQRSKTTSSNTDEFAKDGVETHGVRYNYGLVEYVSNNVKVKIGCQIHGTFEQRPRTHLIGYGCPHCGDSVKYTQKTFAAKGKALYVDLDDYSQFVYVNNHTKGTIICRKHGPYQQMARSHLEGHRCPDCGKNVSRAEVAWLDSIGVPANIRHKHLRIDGRKYQPDAYCAEIKRVWEFYGTFFHGDPRKYKAEDTNPLMKQTYGYLYERTLRRHKEYEEAGYEVIAIWEIDWDQQNKER